MRPLFFRRRKPAGMAHDIVLGEGPADPAITHFALEIRDAIADMPRGEIRTQEVERVAHVQLVAAARIVRHRLQRARTIAHLADRHAP